MSSLIPCGSCARHVRAGDAACPFCGAAVGAPPARPRRVARAVTRAAIFYAGVSLASAGCERGPAPPPEETIAQPYGAPPEPEPPPEPPRQPPPEETIAQPYGAPPMPEPPPDPEGPTIPEE